jgi:hypothetical protein
MWKKQQDIYVKGKNVLVFISISLPAVPKNLNKFCEFWRRI